MSANILFITLDSCRYDTFASANAPNLKRVGDLFRAKSSSHFTYGAHAAFFMGFTPGVASLTALTSIRNTARYSTCKGAVLPVTIRLRCAPPVPNPSIHHRELK